MFKQHIFLSLGQPSSHFSTFEEIFIPDMVEDKNKKDLGADVLSPAEEDKINEKDQHQTVGLFNERVEGVGGEEERALFLILWRRLMKGLVSLSLAGERDCKHGGVDYQDQGSRDRGQR